MAEMQVGMSAQESLDLLPVVLVVADLLAIRTNRQQPAQRFDLGKRLLQFANQALTFQFRPLSLGDVDNEGNGGRAIGQYNLRHFDVK